MACMSPMLLWHRRRQDTRHESDQDPGRGQQGVVVRPALWHWLRVRPEGASVGYPLVTPTPVPRTRLVIDLGRVWE